MGWSSSSHARNTNAFFIYWRSPFRAVCSPPMNTTLRHRAHSVGKPTRRAPLRISGMLIVLALLATFAAPIRHAAAQDQVQQVFDMVNALRAQYGLPPYTPNAALMAAAQAHSDWGASVGYFDHVEPDGSHPTDRAVRAGYGEYGHVRVSENIYYGYLATPESAVAWWTNSPIHFRGMTNPDYQEMGVGVAYGDTGGYFCLLFGLKLENVPAAPPASSNGGNSNGGASQAALPAEPDVPEIATQAAQSDGSIVHVVEEGQAIWNIAAAYGVDVPTLLRQNNLTDNSFVHVGDPIIVRPASTPTPSPLPPTATRPPTLTPIARVAEAEIGGTGQGEATLNEAVGGTSTLSGMRSKIQSVLLATLAAGIGMIVLGMIRIRRG